MEFQQLMAFAVHNNASDIHIQVGLAPALRIGGILKFTNQPPLKHEEVRNFITSIALQRFKENVEDRILAGLDFSYAAPNLSRFRCSAYMQLGNAGVAMRIIRSKILSVAELNLPPIINDIAQSHRGLTLVTGTTGSGK